MINLSLRGLYKVGDKVIVINCEGNGDLHERRPLWYEHEIGQVFTISSIEPIVDIVRVAEKANIGYGLWMTDIIPANSGTFQTYNVSVEMLQEIR